MRFHDWSVGTKLIVLTSLFAIVSLWVAYAGYSALSENIRLLRTTYYDRVIPLKQLKTVADLYAVEVVDTCHKVRSKNVGWDEGLAKINRARNSIEEEWKLYRATELTQLEARLADDAESLMGHANVSVEKLRALLLGKDDAALTSYIENELYPKIDPVSSKLAELVQLQLGVTEENLKEADELYSAHLYSIFFALTIGLAISGIVAFAIVSRVRAAMADLVRVTSTLAKGRLNVDALVHGKDEFGCVAQSFNAMVRSLRDLISSINEVTVSISSAATELSASTEVIEGNVRETSTQAQVVSRSSEHISESIGSAASASEEMSSTVQEIAINAGEAAKVSTDAVERAKCTFDVVKDLGEASTRIGAVVSLINSVAEQTNLLALNATIEAARASEAGRGFAVVANEVKELAKETAKATGDISREIGAMQEHAASTVNAIQEFMEEIRQVNKISLSIAAAVEEQTTATAEISRVIGEAAADSGEISRDIVLVADGSHSSAASVEQIAVTTRELAEMAEKLNEHVSRFTL